MEKFLQRNSKTSSTLNQIALLVVIAAGAAIIFQPVNSELILARTPPTPETVIIADAAQRAGQPLPQPIQPDSEGIYPPTLDAAAKLIDELSQKKIEVDELIQYYESGIRVLAKQIVEHSQKKKIIRFARAISTRRVELDLRIIQRRRGYIRKLENSSSWIKCANEELLFLKRKFQINLALTGIAGGLDLGRDMKHLQAAIQRYQPTADNLSTTLTDTNILPLETIWSQIVKPKDKSAQKALGTAGSEYLKRIGQEKLEVADLLAFHKTISARLPRYSGLIKSAAKRHGFDWHLIAAQIYQESHLNPMAKSRAGARGMMQILPGTARGLGVKDVYNAVENINAGVRHLKVLYDHYDSIAGSDRMMLALAAYNAGRGHVEDARRLAARKNLNPDSWESLTKTLPMLRIRKYYEKSKYGYCRGTEPVNYTKRIMLYYRVLKQQDFELQASQAKL